MTPEGPDASTRTMVITVVVGLLIVALAWASWKLTSMDYPCNVEPLIAGQSGGF